MFRVGPYRQTISQYKDEYGVESSTFVSKYPARQAIDRSGNQETLMVQIYYFFGCVHFVI